MKQNKVKLKKRHGFQFRFWLIALIFIFEILLVIGFVFLLIYSEFAQRLIWIPIVDIFLLDFALGVFIANSKVEASFKISWLAIVFMLPIAGSILYLLFANKMTTKKKKELRYDIINLYMRYTRPNSSEVIKEIASENPAASRISEYIYRNAFTGVYKNTEVTYYKIGDISKEPMVNELKKAKKFIFIEYFIMQSGEFFDSIFDVLCEKAQEGVEVRMIYDDFGCSSKMSTDFFQQVRKAGIKCYPFNTLRPFIDIRQNNRDHRKIIVIDGVVGFTGGINLADEYINKGSAFGLWKDNCVMIKGEGVNGLTNIFLSNWGLVTRTKEDIKTKKPLPIYKEFDYANNAALDTRTSKVFPGFVVPYGEEPFDGENTARNVFLMMINSATKYITISTPYLILDEELVTALSVAAKSGVEVKIITPGTPDKKMIYQCTRSYYSILGISKVQIYEYTPGFNHEKMIVVDGNMAVTGTVNWDFRSLYLHFENGIFFYGSEAVKEMDADLKEMLEVSKKVNYHAYLDAKWTKKVWWSILRIVSPLF
jgi:cardiolipin synthase